MADWIEIVESAGSLPIANGTSAESALEKSSMSARRPAVRVSARNDACSMAARSAIVSFRPHMRNSAA